MKKRISPFMTATATTLLTSLAALVALQTSWVQPAVAGVGKGKCVKASTYMKPNQHLYSTEGVDLSGFNWKGRAHFVLFVTPVSYSGKTANVRIDKITRIWEDFSVPYDQQYWAIRQSDCKRFPCYDEKGRAFYAPSPLPSNAGIGSVINVDADALNSRSEMIYYEKEAAQNPFSRCLYWNDKGWSF